MRGRNEWSETICGSLENQPEILGEAFGRSRRPCAFSAFGAYAARFHSCHVLFDCVNWLEAARQGTTCECEESRIDRGSRKRRRNIQRMPVGKWDYREDLQRYMKSISGNREIGKVSYKWTSDKKGRPAKECVKRKGQGQCEELGELGEEA